LENSLVHVNSNHTITYKKNAVCRIERHENSRSYRVASLARFNRSNAKNRVDNKLLEQRKAKIAYSSAVAERFIAIIKHLVSVGFLLLEDMMNSWDLCTTITTWYNNLIYLLARLQ
jgi:type IV secretory pathway ATPase VirB11/archaellum biosynthesis ATPase